jgi:hypothetical protein
MAVKVKSILKSVKSITDHYSIFFIQQFSIIQLVRKLRDTNEFECSSQSLQTSANEICLILSAASQPGTLVVLGQNS